MHLAGIYELIVVIMEMGNPVVKKSSMAVVLICTLLGIGNAGALVVCFGADGHIEVVSASEEHCCGCPSHDALGETGHRCGSCFDIPLPLGSGEAFLLPVGGEVRDLMVQAESRVCGCSLTPISPDSPEASPGAAACAHKSAISLLSSIVLLICPPPRASSIEVSHRSGCAPCAASFARSGATPEQEPGNERIRPTCAGGLA